jgi:glycosyltransferase involved in cell wall biosynthesis
VSPVSARRVALVLASSTGGIGRHVASLVDGLVAAGVEVSVHGPAATDQQFGFGAAGATFHQLEIPVRPQLRDAVAVRRLARQLHRRPPEGAAERSPRSSGRNLAGHRLPDVLHAHGLRAGLVAALARPDGLPLVVTWHNLLLAGGVRAKLLRGLERYVARSTDVALAASADLVARVRELGGRDVRLGAVAAPALPAPGRSAAEVRHELGLADGQPLVLSVGRLHRQKGYDVLAAAAARWRSRQPPPVVVIAGSGPSYMALAAQISQQRAPVTLLGHRTDIADLLAAADLAVVSSRWEARQLFAQEALRSGTPLVATAVGGLPELLDNAALLVEPGDVDALDAAVQRLLDDPQLRARYGRRALDQAATWPTEADTLAQVLEVYASVIGAAQRGGRPG